MTIPELNVWTHLLIFDHRIIHSNLLFLQSLPKIPKKKKEGAMALLTYGNVELCDQ